MVHPRIHAYPDCLQQGKVRTPLRVRPLVSTCELMRWMQTVDVVRFALFNAFYWPEPHGCTDKKCQGWSCGRGEEDDLVVFCVCALSDVLQDVKDKLHHHGFIASLAPSTVDDGGEHAIQGVEVPSWKGLPIAPSHEPHLKLQNKPEVVWWTWELWVT